MTFKNLQAVGLTCGERYGLPISTCGRAVAAKKREAMERIWQKLLPPWIRQRLCCSALRFHCGDYQELR